MNGAFPFAQKPDAIVVGNQNCIENGINLGVGPQLQQIGGVDVRCWRVPPVSGGIQVGSKTRSATTIGGVKIGGPGNVTNPPRFFGGVGLGGAGRGQVVGPSLAVGGGKYPLRGGVLLGGKRLLGTGGVLLGGTGPLYPLSMRQHQAQNTGGTPPFSFNLSWSPGTANHSWLFAAITALGTSAAPTVTPPTGWLYAIDLIVGKYHAYLFYTKNAGIQVSSGPFVVTVGGANAVAVVNEEWQGFTSASLGFDQSGSASGISANPQTGSVTPSSSAAELAIASITTTNSGTWTGPTNGYALQQGGNANPGNGLLTKAISSAAPTSSVVTNSSGSSQWLGIIATFKV